MNTTIDEERKRNARKGEWTNDENKQLLQLIHQYIARKHLSRTELSKALSQVTKALDRAQGDWEDQLLELQALNNGAFSSNPAEWNVNQNEILDKRVQLLARPEEDLSSDEESNNLKEAVTDEACSVNRTKATICVAANTGPRCELCTSTFKSRSALYCHRKAGNCLLPGISKPDKRSMKETS
jgi:hypothetical protein